MKYFPLNLHRLPRYYFNSPEERYIFYSYWMQDIDEQMKALDNIIKELHLNTRQSRQ